MAKNQIKKRKPYFPCILIVLVPLEQVAVISAVWFDTFLVYFSDILKSDSRDDGVLGVQRYEREER